MIPLYSVDQVKGADIYALNTLTIPGQILMENAAISIFSCITEQYPDMDKSLPVGIICGKGNNGGDGFCLARHFIINGFTVKNIYISGPEELQGEALQNFQILQHIIIRNGEQSSSKKYSSIKDLKQFYGCSVVIDAMLGSGAKGELKTPYSEIIEELNKFNIYRIAVDIPTGLDADTGSGETVFDADLTISLAELKKGLFISSGAVHSGKVKKGSIGIGQDYFNALNVDDYIIEPEDIISNMPVKKKGVNKYSSGKVLIIAGSRDLPGASYLTATAVLKSGAGAAILCAPESIAPIERSRYKEVIVQGYKDDLKGIFTEDNLSELEARFAWMDVLAIGPGLGRDSKTISAVRQVIKANRNKKIVIDADAIFALKDKKYSELDLHNCVLTPHHGEFANLLGISVKELNADLLNYGKKFTQQTGCILVVKGAPTIIFNPAGEALINSTGNPGMAKFGSGDVLTGIVAGLLAQSQNNNEGCVIAAVYLHSLSADLLLQNKTEFGILASEIIENFPTAINFLRKSCV